MPTTRVVWAICNLRLPLFSVSPKMKVSEKSYQPGLLYDLSESLHDIIYSLTCSNPHFEILVSGAHIPFISKAANHGKRSRVIDPLFHGALGTLCRSQLYHIIGWNGNGSRTIPFYNVFQIELPKPERLLAVQLSAFSYWFAFLLDWSWKLVVFEELQMVLGNSFKALAINEAFGSLFWLPNIHFADWINSRRSRLICYLPRTTAWTSAFDVRMSFLERL